ncbi:MAG: helix-turn-helix domain-containing protein [Acholeplasmatales bacterium]|jgi:excisionase family DNA binding protein|nr:helix-turn-helix domain-containing protein [Acholeplasmatales bacterium]
MEFYTLNEIAEILKVTRKTIMNYIRNGKLVAFKMGTNFRVSKDSLINFIESRKYIPK